jgi:uncharacterized protein (DUF1501 family)
MSTRRIFLRNSALAMVGAGSAPLWLQRALYAAESPPRKKILVAIFQRGAADGLNIVVPHGDKDYYTLRPTIAVERKSVIDLDGQFGLHPSLPALKSIYDDRHLAIVDAVGSPDPTRSHFDAQDYMESGTPGLKATNDGWMNRALPAPVGKASPVRALALGSVLPRSLRGHNTALAVQSLNDFQIRATGASKVFESLYKEAPDKALHATGQETFEAMAMLQSIQKQVYAPANGAVYPGGRFGASLKQIAQLIKADAGVEMAFADIGGWDHHVNEPAQLQTLLADFGNSLAAFWRDLGDRMEDVAVITMSEFGRTAKENGNRGTDHGHANVMFAMGGGVRGGKVYGDWPGLAREQLYEARDLNLTTDFRDVLGELVWRHLGNRKLDQVFPGYTAGESNFRGLLAG